MVRKLLSILVLLVVLTLAASRDAGAQMPILYTDTFLPYIAKEILPTFPPCECDPAKPYCVCANAGGQ